jgi:hypothetical protein
MPSPRRAALTADPFTPSPCLAHRPEYGCRTAALTLGRPSRRRQHPLFPRACLFKDTSFSSRVSALPPSSIGASTASSSPRSLPSPARVSNAVSTSHSSYTAQELTHSCRSCSGAGAPAAAAARLRRAGTSAAPQPQANPGIEPKGSAARPPPTPGRFWPTSSPDSSEDRHRLPPGTQLRVP